MSKLTLQTIAGPTSGANANKIIVEDGHLLVDAQGNAIGASEAPSGLILQAIHEIASTTTTVGTSTALDIVSYDITVQQDSKLFIVGGGDWNAINSSYWCRVWVTIDGVKVSNHKVVVSSASSHNVPFTVEYISDALDADTYTVTIRAIAGAGSGIFGEEGAVGQNSPVLNIMEIGA
jgi:hypothetical protein